MHRALEEILSAAYGIAARADRAELTVDDLARGLLVARGELPTRRRLLPLRRRRRSALLASDETAALVAELSKLTGAREIALRLLAEPRSVSALAEDGHDVDALRRRIARE